MTDDYKEQLLNYVTGNLNIEEGNDIPNLKLLNSIENNFNNYMIENIEDIDIYQNTAIYSITDYIKNNNRDEILLYGYYTKQNDYNNNYGFIMILNNNMEIVNVMTKYSTGTEFRNFIALNIAEDNTIFGIDENTDFTIQNRNYRFIMLNDIINSGNIDDTYEVILRKSYNFPSTYNSLFFGYSNDKKNRILKNPNSSDYLFIGRYNSTQTGVLKLSINVGTENEWNMYTYNKDIASSFISTYIEWDNNNLILKIGGSNSYNYYEITLNNNTFSTNLTLQIGSIISSICMQTNSNTYIATSSINDDKKQFNIYKINYDTNNLENIYIKEEPLINYALGNLIMYLENGNIFFRISSYESLRTFNNYIGMIIDKNIYIISAGTSSTRSSSILIVKHDYNLYKLMIQDINEVVRVILIYNPNNYNGNQFINYNGLISHSSILYDENSDIIFSRNLYNKTLLKNSTISTVQIPNNYLNDTTISENELLSETNLTLIQNNQVFTKNIYETVFLNYINTINVIDEDTNTPYVSSAIKVNNSINIGTQTSYENSACTKYRINYTDTTTQINNLEWLPINKYNKTTQITFYVDKNITSIDLISEDETTVYLNIPVEVEIGNTYTIKQKVRTGDKPTPVQLQYNNENINYNNEPVMVYVEEV